ncbi:MAG: methylated-DNA--[protein]-cysteine S-methyltransferase [Gammaproteobacteria bacterium]|nr:methylated-DNA--[protein]-cysteine S-methyltransferase [Gammaproteobacteria bacterium]
MADDYTRIERAIHYLTQHAREQPRLEQVAAHIGLSDYHFQRLFSRWAGISPKRFLQYLTAEHARELLRASRSVLDVSFEAGLSSAGRLHDLTLAIHAAAPGDIKSGGAGLTLHYGVHSSPFGDCFIAVNERGICALEFLAPTSAAQALAHLKQTWPAASLKSSPARTAPTAKQLFSSKRHRTAPLPLFVRGTNFQIKVWEALLRIPAGYVLSYEDVARYLDMPNATRAVASAVANNDIAFLIPCHRVIRKTGVIGEYRWGASRKQALLAWESAHSVKGGSSLSPYTGRGVV